MSPTAGFESQRETLTLISACVRDACLQPAHYVDGALDLVSVCRELAAGGLTHTLVRDGERLGIFTTTDLRDAVLRPEPPTALAVRDLARFELVEADAGADLFEALWLMVRCRVNRLVVRDGAEVVGVLGQLDLVSFVANHSHLAVLQIDQATTTADLRAAAQRIDGLVAQLHDGGLRVERIARLVGELNRRLLARLWQLVAPPQLVANSCLLVMGSEGRGEQIVKTDQDNALVLRDGFDFPQLEEVAREFNAALIDCGWPPCPGEIMLTNPAWRGSAGQFRDAMRDWVYGSQPQGVMHLAMFFDAYAVAGDATLADGLREHLARILVGGDAFFARFAAAADQFDEPASWWSRLTARADEQPLDLKKLGSFPIVHGVRALALCHGICERGTADRLKRLADLGQFDAALGTDLVEALYYLMGLKLRQQLRQRAGGEAASNLVRPSELSTLDRDQLKGALAIVRRFRAVLRQRFHLDSL
ncbi:MAG: CBS domain-containing protein [Burkholderiales bacterium]|nr:CBS domain-containing protein [Burkholderiales bacterium]